MNKQNDHIIKLCSFYVSDWHLVTMLIPYISKKIDEEAKIATILEKDIKTNVTTLIEKLNLKNEKKILNINWSVKNASKYEKISKIIENNIGNNLIIIINGKKEYIEKANNNLERYIEKNETKLIETNTKIKIINCYEIIEFNGNIVEILDKHNKILNTSGEKEITDVFVDYVRKEKIS